MAEELYAWRVTEADGTEGTIAADTGVGLGMHLLVFRSKYMAEAVREIARAHANASGRPVVLVKFTRAEQIERIEPETIEQSAS